MAATVIYQFCFSDTIILSFLTELPDCTITENKVYIQALVIQTVILTITLTAGAESPILPINAIGHFHSDYYLIMLIINYYFLNQLSIL